MGDVSGYCQYHVLVEAPVDWYNSISTVLEEHGWRRLEPEPCCWILIDQTWSESAVVGGHVDDFVFVGKEGNNVWEKARKRVQDHFRWMM